MPDWLIFGSCQVMTWLFWPLSNNKLALFLKKYQATLNTRTAGWRVKDSESTLSWDLSAKRVFLSPFRSDYPILPGPYNKNGIFSKVFP